jgi:hypothetical protein
LAVEPVDDSSVKKKKKDKKLAESTFKIGLRPSLAQKRGLHAQLRGTLLAYNMTLHLLKTRYDDLLDECVGRRMKRVAEECRDDLKQKMARYAALSVRIVEDDEVPCAEHNEYFRLRAYLGPTSMDPQAKIVTKIKPNDLTPEEAKKNGTQRMHCHKQQHN